jgi:hypothetical protein
MGGTCSIRCGYDNNLKGQIHSRNAVFVSMIILKSILRKYDLMVSRFSWFVSQMGNCERCKELNWFRKMGEISS